MPARRPPHPGFRVAGSPSGSLSPASASALPSLWRAPLLMRGQPENPERTTRGRRRMLSCEQVQLVSRKLQRYTGGGGSSSSGDGRAAGFPGSDLGPFPFPTRPRPPLRSALGLSLEFPAGERTPPARASLHAPSLGGPGRAGERSPGGGRPGAERGACPGAVVRDAAAATAGLRWLSASGARVGWVSGRGPRPPDFSPALAGPRGAPRGPGCARAAALLRAASRRPSARPEAPRGHHAGAAAALRVFQRGERAQVEGAAGACAEKGRGAEPASRPQSAQGRARAGRRGATAVFLPGLRSRGGLLRLRGSPRPLLQLLSLARDAWEGRTQSGRVGLDHPSAEARVGGASVFRGGQRRPLPTFWILPSCGQPLVLGVQCSHWLESALATVLA